MSVNLLAKIPFFTGLPEKELDRLTAEMVVVNLKPGELLFCEGDPGEHLYVIVKGDLEIVKAFSCYETSTLEEITCFSLVSKNF